MPTIAKGRSAGRIPAAELADHDAAMLAAAGDLFRRHGFGGTSIELIARVASVSPKTIYARYGGKAGLLAAVVERTTRAPLRAFDALEQGGDPAAVLTHVAGALLERVLEPEAVALERVVIAEAHTQPDLGRTFYERGPAIASERLRAWLARQHRAGVLAVPDPVRSAAAFIAIVEGAPVRRALLLGADVTKAERRAWVTFAVTTFLRAHAP